MLTDVRGTTVAEHVSKTVTVAGFKSRHIRIRIFFSIAADTGKQAPELGFIGGHSGKSFDIVRPGITVVVADIVSESESELLHIIDAGGLLAALTGL